MRPMPRCSPAGVPSLSDGRGIRRGATNANLGVALRGGAKQVAPSDEKQRCCFAWQAAAASGGGSAGARGCLGRERAKLNGGRPSAMDRHADRERQNSADALSHGVT